MEKENSNKHVYFSGLTGLRFFAAFVVILCHVEEFKSIWNIRETNTWDLHFFSLMGELGVTFFFVLSGFLITYLLLMEKERMGTIAIKQFYMRRVLRIVPLYYLIIFLGLFIFPQFEILDFPEWSDQIDGNFRLKVLMYTLFLSNLAIASIFPIPYVIHVWSIGVEEQFYLLWPFLVKHFKKTFRLLIGIIVIYLILAKGFMYLNDLHEGTNRLYQVVADFLKYTRIDCMAIGGIGGYAVYLNQTWVLNFIYQKSFQIGLYVVTILLIFTQLEFGYFTHEVYAIVFCLIILNIGNNKNTFFQLEHPTFKYLGKISYGLYMYNYLCVRLAMIVVQYFYGENVLLGLSGNVLLYILSIAFTIGLSALSYEYFEKPFLRFKHRFTIIKSGETFRGNDNLLF
jgi:peptidoglycan/LPS O-acetylase OafA/YrhL